jgi:pseudouridine kinase
MTPGIVCFGAAHADIRAHARDPIIDGTSNPVETTRARGGVAGNVAAWLAGLGHEVSLISRLGRDAAGDGVLGALTEIGVNCSAISRSPNAPTASYTAVLEPSGDLRLGLADMAIYDEITPDMIRRALGRTGPAGIWFLDANLPQAVIRHLATQAPGSILLAGDTVSVPKAPRLRAACPRLDLLITNTKEVEAIFDASSEPDIAARLDANGIGRAIIGRAHEGVRVVDGDGIRDRASLVSRLIDVTGAGDALAAGILHGVLTGRPALETIQIGLAAAALAVESDTPLPASVDRVTLLDRASLRG